MGSNGLWLGSTAFGGGAKGYAFSDDDGDGTWSVTVPVVGGHSGVYTFFNSPTADDDWIAGEQLHGQDCAITPAPTPNPTPSPSRRRDRRLTNFDDHGRRLSGRRRDDGRRRDTSRRRHETHRNLPPVNETTELSFCFGNCYPTDGSCTAWPTPAPTASPTPAPTGTPVELTFHVNTELIEVGGKVVDGILNIRLNCLQWFGNRICKISADFVGL